MKSKEISATRGADATYEDSAASRDSPGRKSTSSSPAITPSRQRPLSDDELSETHRYTNSPQYMRELRETRASAGETLSRFDKTDPHSNVSHELSPPRQGGGRVAEHSLYDILKMDPRTDFASSPSR